MLGSKDPVEHLCQFPRPTYGFFGKNARFEIPQSNPSSDFPVGLFIENIAGVLEEFPDDAAKQRTHSNLPRRGVGEWERFNHLQKALTAYRSGGSRRSGKTNSSLTTSTSIESFGSIPTSIIKRVRLIFSPASDIRLQQRYGVPSLLWRIPPWNLPLAVTTVTGRRLRYSDRTLIHDFLRMFISVRTSPSL